MATTKPPNPPPINTPFFEKDKSTFPPLVPCQPWIDWMEESVFEQFVSIFEIIEEGLVALPANQTEVGALTDTADTPVLTVTLARTTRLVCVFNNKGATDTQLVNVSVTKGGTTSRILTGNTDNSPSLAGTGPGVDISIRLETGDTVNAWLDTGGTDVDFTVTVEGEE